jgi:tripartite-type tricarboxylate transporter receptor subunit TctC
MTMNRRSAIASIAVAAAMGLALPATAQTVEEFYTGKTIELYIGYTVGGGYDTYARALARHMGKHIPGNPTVVPVNMDGAGSLRMTNWLYSAAPKDGTVFGTFARAAPFDPLFGNPDAQFDGRQFNYIGSANNEVSICAAMARTGIETFDQLKTQELIIGGTGDTADTVQFPKVLNAVFGTQMKIINGYPGGNDVVMAMERQEVDGRCGWSYSSLISGNGDWVEQGTVNILMQLSTAKHPALPDVPLVMDLVTNDADRDLLNLVFARQTLGRPFAAPPGVPADRVEALRAAFMATMADPEFLADAAAQDLEITPVDGATVQALVDQGYAADPAVVERLNSILQ